MREITYKIFTFLLIGSVLISCSKENTGYGALSLSLKGDISVGISSNSATKAGEINTEDFEIFVGDKSLGLKKELEDPITLAIGTYTVSAQNCSQSTANNGSGLLRFYGEDNNVTITTGETSTATINCKVVNSKVSILLGDSYTSYFDMGYTSVSVSETICKLLSLSTDE